MMDHAQNSVEAAPNRVVGRPFQPGQSGNPGGRPAIPHPATRLGELTAERQDVVDFVVKVFHGHAGKQWQHPKYRHGPSTGSAIGYGASLKKNSRSTPTSNPTAWVIRHWLSTPLRSYGGSGMSFAPATPWLSKGKKLTKNKGWRMPAHRDSPPGWDPFSGSTPSKNGVGFLTLSHC